LILYSTGRNKASPSTVIRRKKMNDKSKNAIVEIRNLLKECVEYGHYPNWDFTKEKLKKVASYEKKISKEEYLAVEKICQEVIFPTYFDENYRKSFYEKELENRKCNIQEMC